MNVVAIRIPPLRERMQDLPDLAEHILGSLCVRHHRDALQITDYARHALMEYHWPGNIRDLVNTLERAVVLARDNLICTEDLPDRLVAPPTAAPAAPASGLSLEELERRHIEQALAEAETLEEAASRLGINPTTLWRKRKRYGIE